MRLKLQRRQRWRVARNPTCSIWRRLESSNWWRKTRIPDFWSRLSTWAFYPARTITRRRRRLRLPIRIAPLKVNAEASSAIPGPLQDRWIRIGRLWLSNNSFVGCVAQPCRFLIRLFRFYSHFLLKHFCTLWLSLFLYIRIPVYNIFKLNLRSE